MIIAQLNLNSLRNLFHCLVQQFIENVDILMVSETKLDNSFPVGKFLIHCYGPPIRLDRDIHAGDLMLNASLKVFRYIREYDNWSIAIVRVSATFLKHRCYTCIF